jgi:hypothetical protein
VFYLVACAVCGGDPATDAMLVNAAVAGAISMPWMFRAKIAATLRRIRGGTQPHEESCPIEPSEDD